jgi:hypothetical protein
MTAPRVVLICLACLGLAVPAIAFAQSGAGDNQYQDPLGSTQTTQTSGTVTTQTPPPLTKTPPKPPPAPARSPASSTSPATATATPLANTGAEPGLFALLGLGLVLAGFGLRVRASELA